MENASNNGTHMCRTAFTRNGDTLTGCPGNIHPSTITIRNFFVKNYPGRLAAGAWPQAPGQERETLTSSFAAKWENSMENVALPWVTLLRDVE